MVTDTSTRLADAKQAIRRAQECLDDALSMMDDGLLAGASLALDNVVTHARKANYAVFGELSSQPVGGIDQYQRESR